MTLSRQLMILITALVVVLFLGSFTISVYNARDYIESQLQSHAQDAATSLGLSATAHVERGDQAMVTAMVNAMFHRGDYLGIRLEDLDGQVWLERSLELQVDDVPGWFMRVFALQPPEGSATMMAGWRQVGGVRVTSHPGLAYRRLWETAVDTLTLFLGGALSALLAGVLGLRLLLRPLREVELQAEAICDRGFPVVERRPFTLEFRRVVEAMNRLSRRVERLVSDAERNAAHLRQQAFQDPVTGLANRRQFMDVLEHRIADPQLFATGGLLLLQLNAFKAYNQAQGYQAGDLLLRETAQALSRVVAGQPDATLARLTGADFAVLLDGVGGERLRDLAARAVGAVAALYGRLELPSADVAHAGGAVYRGQDAAGLLAEADMALRAAQREGANAWVVQLQGTEGTTVRPGSAWRALIEGAIRERRFTLLRQPVVGCGDRGLLHHEVFLRLQDPADPDGHIAAAAFMPMAEGLGLAPLIDRAVAEAVIGELDAGAYPRGVAVNLSGASLADGELLAWLQAQLRQRPSVAARLILEFPDYGALARGDRLATWIDGLAPLGVRFSLDHFGKGFASFAYLRAIKVDYLKVDGSFVRGVDRQETQRFYLRAITDIAHGLDMAVIAESVETGSDWAALNEIGIDGGRGFWLGPPE